MSYDFRLWFPTWVLVRDYFRCHDFRLRFPSGSLAEQHTVALQTVG